MSGNFVSYQDADALMTKIAQKISGGGGTDKAILYYMTDNAMYDGYHVRATGLLSGTVYNTVLDSEGNGDVEVEGMERYSIDFYYIDENEQEVSVYQTDVDAHTGHFFYIPLGYDKTSWQGIQNILDAHKELDLLSIGDEVHTSIGGADTIFQIAAINLYDTHEVIFVAKNCVGTLQKFNSSNDGSTWNGCSLKGYLNNTLKAQLPEEVRNHLKALSFYAYSVPTDCYLWVPHEYEIFGAISYSYTGEPDHCTQYPIFTTASQRIKKYNGSAYNWWTADRCAAGGKENYAVYVNTAGNNGGNDKLMGNTLGVVPCFRFTADV